MCFCGVRVVGNGALKSHRVCLHELYSELKSCKSPKVEKCGNPAATCLNPDALMLRQVVRALKHLEDEKLHEVGPRQARPLQG